MQRLIAVYNPNSSKYGRVKSEVLDKLRSLKGWTVGRYEIKPVSLEENAMALSELLQDGDLVVSIGGDGTAAVTANAILGSKKAVRLGVLGYGNFNDLSRTFKTKTLDDLMNGKTVKVWPLEATIDGKRWRFALGYITIGLFAEATAVFDDEKTRKKLRSGRKTPVFSWKVLAKWYFRNRKKREFLPPVKLNGRSLAKNTTDYVALNGKSMAGVMRGRNWFLKPRVFQSETAGLRKFSKLMTLMLKSMIYKVPGKKTEGDILEFKDPAEIMIQAEGEYTRFAGVKQIEIKKAERCLNVVMN